MTCTIDGSIALDESFETRHWRVRPAAFQMTAASLSAPLTIPFEMSGAAATTRASDEGTFTGGRAVAARFALSVVSAAGPLDPHATIEIKASQIMHW
jgi:hypothetical protein